MLQRRMHRDQSIHSTSDQTDESLLERILTMDRSDRKKRITRDQSMNTSRSNRSSGTPSEKVSSVDLRDLADSLHSADKRSFLLQSPGKDRMVPLYLLSSSPIGKSFFEYNGCLRTAASHLFFFSLRAGSSALNRLILCCGAHSLSMVGLHSISHSLPGMLLLLSLLQRLAATTSSDSGHTTGEVR